MTSKIEICNMALAYLGQYPISSLEQETEPARWLKLFYNPVRDEVLRVHNWAFATVEKPLTQVQNPAGMQGKWVYKYPSDALFIRGVFSPQDSQAPLPFTERFEPDLAMRVLVTSVPHAIARYTRRITDETQYDPAFAKCFALALACDTVLVLTGDSALGARLEQKYALALEEARRANMTENCVLSASNDAFSEVR